jgi:hypothetical protein
MVWVDPITGTNPELILFHGTIADFDQLSFHSQSDVAGAGHLFANARIVWAGQP